MRWNNFRYFIAEGFRSFWVNGLMSAASVMIVTASLLLFGIYILFSLNLNFIGDQLQSQYEIQVFIEDTASSEEVEAIGDKIAAMDQVNQVEFFSKEEALADYREQLGEDANILDGLESDNPLRDSYKVTLTDLSYADTVVAEIGSLSNIGMVRNNKDVMDKIINITSVVKTVSIWLMALLSLIAVFIISNTIKLTVFARRREITIMKYLGATDWFISWPFVVEGVVIGIIGALISLGIVCPAYNYFIGGVQSFLANQVRVFTTWEVLDQLIMWFAGIGVLLGALGSAISLRRHLHV